MRTAQERRSGGILAKGRAGANTAAWKALECLQNLEESSEVTERDPDIRWEKEGRGRLPRAPAAFF